jgi:hypothetical protein
VTGWNYNDKNMGGYQIAKAKEQGNVFGLVFVQAVSSPWVRLKKM